MNILRTPPHIWQQVLSQESTLDKTDAKSWVGIMLAHKFGPNRSIRKFLESAKSGLEAGARGSRAVFELMTCMCSSFYPPLNKLDDNLTEELVEIPHQLFMDVFNAAYACKPTSPEEYSKQALCCAKITDFMSSVGPLHYSWVHDMLKRTVALERKCKRAGLAVPAQMRARIEDLAPQFAHAEKQVATRKEDLLEVEKQIRKWFPSKHEFDAGFDSCKCCDRDHFRLRMQGLDKAFGIYSKKDLDTGCLELFDSLEKCVEVGEFEVGHHVCECLHVLKFDPEFSQVCLDRMMELSEKLRNSIRPKNYTQWRVKLVATELLVWSCSLSQPERRRILNKALLKLHEVAEKRKYTRDDRELRSHAHTKQQFTLASEQSQYIRRMQELERQGKATFGHRKGDVLVDKALNKVRECAACGQAETADRRLQVCSRCKGVRYCSAECQRKDWKKRHKKVCKKSPEAESATK